MVVIMTPGEPDSFNMGLDILNQMRTQVSFILPDEKRLSFVPLLKVILLSIPAQGSERLIQVLDNELSAIMKINALEMKPYIDNIVNENRCWLLMDINYHNLIRHRFLTLIKRLHGSKDFLNYLVKNIPAGWNNNDLVAINFVLDMINSSEIVPEQINDVDELYGNNVESVENVKEWIQDIFNLIKGGRCRICRCRK